MAAMLVVIHHFWPSGDLTTNWLKWSIGRGYLWVDFFVLK
jgi:peptidoglycan/LPS O-acetylase OafA/YrhL